jgi:hypothetical protein
MADWAGSYTRGQEVTRTRLRQDRLDQINEELARGRMSLMEAAARRAQALADEKLASGKFARERFDQRDRAGALARDTGPFGQLLRILPEAGASPYTQTAERLDAMFARDPRIADRRIEDPAIRVQGTPETNGAPWEIKQGPTMREERERNVNAAYDMFGDALSKRLKAAAELKRATARGASPPTDDLKILLRGIEARLKDALLMSKGLYLDPKEGVKQILDPEGRARAMKEGPILAQKAKAERAMVLRTYGQRTNTTPPELPGVNWQGGGSDLYEATEAELLQMLEEAK